MAEQLPTIISVVDTRDYMELDDRWVAIPGSGITLECERCGRGHEVHVTVEYADGTSKVVGTGCAERGEQFGRKMASAAGTVARNRSKLARLEQWLALAEAATAAAAELELPAITTEPGMNEGTTWLVAGGVRVLVMRHADMAERQQALRSCYRDRQADTIMEQAGFRPARPYVLRSQVEDARRALRTAEARLAAVS